MRLEHAKAPEGDRNRPVAASGGAIGGARTPKAAPALRKLTAIGGLESREQQITAAGRGLMRPIVRQAKLGEEGVM